ncbi:MAG: hypothetical protein ABI821_10935 [Pseudomonadota bacterium]
MWSGSVLRIVVVGALAALTGCGGGGGGGTNPPGPPGDTTAPDTTIGATPNALTNQPTATFQFTSTETGTFEGSLDGAAFTTVSSPFVTAALADGAHTLAVRARDAAGNVDATPASLTWTIDTVAPVATITSGPSAETASTSATITFTTEAGTTVEAFTPSGGPTTVASPLQLTGLTDGMKAVSLRARDAAGNLQLVAAERVWRVDSTAPTAQIVFPTPMSYTDEANIAVRATVVDAGTIAAVRINGVAATLLSGNTYTARVPVSPGDNTLTVSTTDNLGNSDAHAATASIANRDTVIYKMAAMVWDAAGNRALVADSERHALLALRGTDGYATILSDDDHGTGARFSGSSPLALDAANNRVLALGESEVIAINLTTGSRTTVVATPGLNEVADVAHMICASPCTQLYATGMPSGTIVWQSAVFTINLATGAQNVISGGDFAVGTGPALINPSGMVLDNSTGTLRALVSDYAADAIFAVDFATGARTVLSSASVGTGTAMEGPAGLALDPATSRLFVGDNATSPYVGRVFQVNLANGNRTTIVAPPSSGTFKSIFNLRYDTANDRLLVPQFPSSVSQVPLNAPAVNRLSDSFVGTGAALTSLSSLILDPRTVAPTLLATTTGLVVRVNSLTGDRTDVVATTVAPGGAQFTARHLQLDLRNTPVADRVIMDDTGSTFHLYTYDSNAVFTRQSHATLPFTAPGPEFQYDAPNDRMILAYTQPGVRFVIQPMDVTTGTLGTPIAESPWGAPTFSEVRALALDTVGNSRRLLAADSGGNAHSFDLASGARTPIGQGLGYIDAMDINSPGRLAYLVSGSDHTLIRLDLAGGGHTTVSGLAVGQGPKIMPGFARIAGEFARDLVYVLSNEDTILAVDLLNGERVILSR